MLPPLATSLNLSTVTVVGQLVPAQVCDFCIDTAGVQGSFKSLLGKLPKLVDAGHGRKDGGAGYGQSIFPSLSKAERPPQS